LEQIRQQYQGCRRDTHHLAMPELILQEITRQSPWQLQGFFRFSSPASPTFLMSVRMVMLSVRAAQPHRGSEADQPFDRTWHCLTCALQACVRRKEADGGSRPWGDMGDALQEHLCRSLSLPRASRREA
jgi:hypothetical protein